MSNFVALMAAAEWHREKVLAFSRCFFVGSSRKVGEANKGLGEAPKSCTRKEHESATNPIAKRGQGAIAPCRVKGQRPLWGLGQRPNCSASDQSQGSRQQRCRQRSVPAPNFARPQTRPQAALSPRFREEPYMSKPQGVDMRSAACFYSFGVTDAISRFILFPDSTATAACACTSGNRISTASPQPECGHQPSADAAVLRRFRGARRRSAYRRSRCPSSFGEAGW